MSVSSSDFSQASTKLDNDSPVSSPTIRASPRRKLKRSSINAQDLLLFLIAFRILNALSVKTFFQPDEFFQSLEPAWQMVFGKESGAWLTWEWRSQLRSTIHPTIFAAVYYLCDRIAQVLRLNGTSTAELLIAGPKLLQAVLAALQDFYTWQLAQKVYGPESNQAIIALALSVVSPWQWFCSTRTFSNGFETTLTIAALYYWPWHWLLPKDRGAPTDENGLKRDNSIDDSSVDEITKLRRCLILAGLACIIRPTNILIWIPLSVSVLFKPKEIGWLASFPLLKQTTLFNLSYPTIRRDTQNESIALIKGAFVCGSFVLLLSVLIDRSFYHAWAFPPLKFLLFNVVQSLAVFYGRNDWHYYLSQGLPLLLTTALPFTLVSLAKGYFAQPSRPDSTDFERQTIKKMIGISLVLPGVLSLLSHKEVRFIYPLLPILHIVTAPTICSFFEPVIGSPSPIFSLQASRPILLKRLLLGVLLFLNGFIAFYTTQIHAPGTVDVMNYLRHQYLKYYNPTQHTGSELLNSTNIDLPVMTVGFLMPCHSTPWRSHLVYPSIHSWALTCEPPLGLTPTEKTTYLDEADQFYDNPLHWLRLNMTRNPPRPKGIFTSSQNQRWAAANSNTNPLMRGKSTKRDWPEYIVFFQQLEPTMDVLLRGSGYAECWRGWNTAWHDDSRRKGDVVAWCLYPERRILPGQASGTNITTKIRDGFKKLTGLMARFVQEPNEAINLLQEMVSEKLTRMKSNRIISGSWIPSFPSLPGWPLGNRKPPQPRRWFNGIFTIGSNQQQKKRITNRNKQKQQRKRASKERDLWS